MYWPTSAARVLGVPFPLDKGRLIRIRQSRKGNFFAALTKDALGVWDVRPTVMQAAVVRTAQSLERWGNNVDVFWANDGRGLIILTSTSHLLFYQLVSTSKPSYDTPSTSTFPSSVGPGEGDVLMGWELRSLGVAFVMGGCESVLPQQHALLLTLRHPPSILSVPYPLPQQLVCSPGSHFPPIPLDGEGEEQVECDVWDLDKAREWMGHEGEVPPVPTRLSITRTQGLPSLHTMLTDDGRVYAMYTSSQLAHIMPDTPSRATSPAPRTPLPPHQASPAGYFHPPSSASKYIGQPLYPAAPPRNPDAPVEGVEALGLIDTPTSSDAQHGSFHRAVHVSVNSRFGLAAVGTVSGTVQIISIPPYPLPPRASHVLDLKRSANLRVSPGRVTALAWTSDGYGLAVGYEKGWAVWSMGGRLGGWGMEGQDEASTEGFMQGVTDLFWAPGNLELFVLARNSPLDPEERLYSVPFAKSATTGQHSPDNTRYAFLQMDDRVLVYRGADQPDMSVINPESDVWQHIKIPNAYIATNWPIRYASISSDGRLIAVAGRRGLTHYSASSGRWKLFVDERQERDFIVRGGLLWFHHVLVAAVEVDRQYQIRLYSRDLDLADQNILHSQALPSPVLVMSLLDNSLLVYTADNTLYHFLILPTKETIKVHLCGSISFQGIVQVPSRVRALSWLVPEAQKQLGDPADDLIVATIIFLVDGKLMLLRPRRAGNDEVRYDMQVLADRIEAYWTHLHGVGTLENSLWGYDGSAMRVWLDALTIEATRVEPTRDAYESVKESVYLRLDFYPLSILMDKGIIIGVDYETSTRNLPFSVFKIQTGTHLFLPRFLRYHLAGGHLAQALALAANYAELVYFAHALEILLHSVLEEEVDSGLDTLPLVIRFLDHFPESLDVVVGCARKTEVERWSMLFDTVGKPRELFEKCLENGSLRTAASYLLVLHTLEELDDAKDTVRLLRLAMAAKEFHLCKELLRFLHSIDESGAALRTAIEDLGIAQPPTPTEDTQLRVLPEPPNTTPSADPGQPALADIPTVSESEALSAAAPTSRAGEVATASVTTDSAVEHLTINGGAGRATSQFQLSSPRVFTSPPSPRTVDPNGTDTSGIMPTPLAVQVNGDEAGTDRAEDTPAPADEPTNR